MYYMYFETQPVISVIYKIRKSHICQRKSALTDNLCLLQQIKFYALYKTASLVTKILVVQKIVQWHIGE